MTQDDDVTAAVPSKPDPARSLVLAIIATSTAPLVLLGPDLTVVAASRSFYRVFGIKAAQGAPRLFFDLGVGEWDTPQLRSLLNAVLARAEVGAYEFDWVRAGQETRRLVLDAHKLDYEDTESARVLLSITDITAARALESSRDLLIREKAILLKEVKNRLANSLQIITAVLMQSARQAGPSKARAHLGDAHQPKLSMEEVQRHLSSSGQEDVHLKPYFTQLCDVLAASMIRDHGELSLEVESDDTTAVADDSVSLGLIVTELVINALKHGFPDSRIGRINVGYQARGGNWILSVADNGVGMPVGSEPAKGGLGTSIVEALAHQLHAHIQVADNQPGTKVSIVHWQLAAVESGDTSEFERPAI
jgi:two-component system, sensor histidine kinase PdtaS